MPQRIAPTFRNLSQLANNLGDDTSIIVKNNSFETRGKIGALFTRKAGNRAAGEVLYAGIRRTYGDTVADALAPQIRASREKGKPLTARVARDILATAADMSRGIGQINTDMARHLSSVITDRATPAIWILPLTPSVPRRALTLLPIRH